MSSADHMVVVPCNCDCNLAINQPHTYKNGAFIFSDMSPLKFASMTRAPFPSIPQTYSTWRKISPLIMAVITSPILLLILPTNYDLIYWIILIGAYAIISKFVLMMASFWSFHKKRMGKPPLVSNPPLPLLTPSSDLLRHWWIRGLTYTQ